MVQLIVKLYKIQRNEIQLKNLITTLQDCYKQKDFTIQFKNNQSIIVNKEYYCVFSGYTSFNIYEDETLTSLFNTVKYIDIDNIIIDGDTIDVDSYYTISIFEDAELNFIDTDNNIYTCTYEDGNYIVELEKDKLYSITENLTDYELNIKEYTPTKTDIEYLDLYLTDVEEVKLTLKILYDTKPVSDVKVNLIDSEDDNIQFTGKSDSNGECIIHIGYLFKKYYIEIGCTNYDINNINDFTPDSKNNNLTLYLNKLDECNNRVLVNKECKYFLHEPFMTPNNYDVYFDYAMIPVNNIIESPSDILKRLQRNVPLTDILHLNLETADYEEYNSIHLHTELKLKTNPTENNMGLFQITTEWYDIDDKEDIHVEISDGENIIGSVDLTEENNWTHELLLNYIDSNGDIINYTLSYNESESYTVYINGKEIREIKLL